MHLKPYTQSDAPKAMRFTAIQSTHPHKAYAQNSPSKYTSTATAQSIRPKHPPKAYLQSIHPNNTYKMVDIKTSAANVQI